MSKSPPVPTDRELQQLLEQLCNQATDIAAAFRSCRCSENVRATVQDGRGGVNALNQGTTAPSDEPAENTRTFETQTVPAIPESQEPALQGATTIPSGGHAEGTSKTGTQTSPGEERIESPINEIPAESAHGPLTLMRLPREVRALIWWETLRPEGGFVPIVPWARNGHLDNKGRIRASPVGFRGNISTGEFHRARTALIDRKRCSFLSERDPISMGFAQSWERMGEHLGGRETRGWSLLHINKQIYEEAEAAYWRRVTSDGLMLSFGCGRRMGDYWGVAVARTFFNDFTTQYLQTIRRIHLDLRRPDNDDGPNGYGGQAFVLQSAGGRIVNFMRNLGTVLTNISTRLTGLQHLSLTFGGWVPDVRQTPWVEDTDSPDFNARIQSSQYWVTRLQNITGLTRLRLRVMYAPRDPETINARLDQDPGVQRTIHFMSMLRGSMLVNGHALGVGNMRAWANKRRLEFATAERFRIVVQCDDSWDEENKEHRHHVEDDEYDPIGGLNHFGDKFRWDPDAET